MAKVTYFCPNVGLCEIADRRRPVVSTDPDAVCAECGAALVRRAVGASSGSVVGLSILAAALIAILAVLIVLRHPKEDAGAGRVAEPGAGSRSETTVINPRPQPNPTTPQEPVRPLPPAVKDLFGMVEVGAKGVKGIVIDLIKANGNEECEKSEEAFAECVGAAVVKQFDPLNVNALNEAAIPEAASAVKSVAWEMQERYRVDARQIYVVGASSIAQVPHRDRLKDAVERALERPEAMTFVSAEEEGRLAFEGTLQLIPEKWRAERRRQVVLLDIGSGNTKGGYMEEPGPRFVAITLDIGTKTFADRINRERGDKGFADVAEKLRVSVLRPLIRPEVGRRQAMSNRPRVYLIGGIAWAVTTLVQPQDRRHFPAIYPEHFDMLFARVNKSDAAIRLCGANPVRDANPEIDKVCNAFNIPNDLLAGLKILKTFSTEMDFSHKKVFFIRDSLYVWPLAYLRKRCAEDGTCVGLAH